MLGSLYRRMALALASAAVLGSAAMAQSRKPIDGLKNNSEYINLIETEKRLRLRDDSLSRVLDGMREQLRRSPQDRAKLGNGILEIEGRLFDLRSEIGGITGRISAIEQDYVMKSLGNGGSGSGAARPVASSRRADLVANGYFRANLRADDYDLLLQTQARERELPEYAERYKRNYALLTEIESRYPREKEETVADSLYEAYVSLTDLNLGIADSLDSVWRFISDNKMYVYSYLLEKMNRMDLLEQINGVVTQERDREAEMAGRYSADAVAFYPMRKSLMLDVEMKIAELIGLPEALDSLSAVHKAVNARSYAYDPIDIEERLFVDFQPVTVAAGKYNSANPIPEMEVQDKGMIYMIQLGTYQRRAAVSVFRNLYPLTYHIGDDGKYRYYAGCYEDIDCAIEGLARVKKSGFRDAFLVVWDRGVPRNIGDGTAAKGDGKDVFYRVEINSGGVELPAAVRDLIANSGKELTRVGAMIVVGTFPTQLDAEKLLSDVKELASDLEVKVSRVE